MSTREKQYSWVIIVAAAVFIAGYLLRYGEAAYRGEGQPARTVIAPAQASVATPDSEPVSETVEPVRETRAATPEPTAEPDEMPRIPTRPGVKSLAATSAPKPAAVDPGRQPPEVEPSPGPAPDKAPRIRFKQPEFDFGSLYQEESVTHEYAFRNVGESPLIIERVNTSCGCTAAKPPEGEIAPGETGAIKVTFSAGRMRNRVSKHVFVESNDPTEPRATLTITGMVKVEVEVVPTGIYFSTLQVGQTTERSVVLKPVEVKAFRILDTKSSDSGIVVSKPVPAGKPEPEGSYRLTIKIGPVLEPKRISGKVVIRTDLQHQKEITVSVYGRVVSEPAAADPGQEGSDGAPPQP